MDIGIGESVSNEGILHIKGFFVIEILSMGKEIATGFIPSFVQGQCFQNIGNVKVFSDIAREKKHLAEELRKKGLLTKNAIKL